MADRIRSTLRGALITRTKGRTPPDEVSGPAVAPTSGQCTDWASYKRPDLGFYGDGQYWAKGAREEGFPVDALPRVGDIAVWDANENYAGPSGHVAYVEEVFPDGTFRVSEFNWGGVPEAYGDRRLVSPVGLDFIHRK